MWRPVLLCLILALSPPAAGQRPPGDGQAPAPIRITGLETDATANPLGIDDPAPRFTWRIEGEGRGIVQTNYRVLVASRPELLDAGRADVWDSGTISTSDPWVRYGGPALQSRTRYFWTVDAGVSPGRAIAASPPSWFETAQLDPAEWKAQWIAGPERPRALTDAEGNADDAAIHAAGEFCRPVQWLTSGFAAKRITNNQGECRELRPAPRLRKTFTVSRQVVAARLYASGLAYGHITINGAPVSTSVLDPGFTDYSKTVLYTTHDVTGLVRAGQNVVAAELGSGQYDSATRTWDWGWEQAEWRATPQLILQLHVRHDDGSETLVTSDPAWRVSVAGPRRYDSYYLGETYDARREIRGWEGSAFDDTAWTSARAVRAPAGTMRAQAHEAIAVISERLAGTRSEPSPGVFVYDVGQNLTGWAEIGVTAREGTAIEVFYSEKRGADGKASIAGNDLVFGQLQTDYYVAKGGGKEVWEPRFTYKGFQYIQVSGPRGQPLPSGTTVAVERVRQIRSSVARTSTFDSDQPTLNRIHQNTVWAIQNNMHGIVTDTPVYEKNAWTGDAQLTSGAASLLFDTERLYTKLTQDMRDAQTEQGEVPLLAPSNENYGYVGKPAFKPVECCGATPAWDAFWFVIPWESYRRYGDLRALERAYPAMQRYLDTWIPQWTNKDGDAYAQTLTAGLGDWVPPKGVPTVNAIASTAYYAHMVQIAAEVARALNKPQEATRYQQLFDRIRTDLNARFLASDGLYRERPNDPFVQTAQILPLAFGLVPDAQRAGIVAKLADDISKNRGGNAYVGVLGARYVLPVLTATGNHDLACTVATQIDEPSWGYWTDVAGFTSLGEHWTAETRSRNHHMFGAIVQWFYEDLAGIRPLDPAYGTIEFRPSMPSKGIDRISASYESVRGRIASGWQRSAKTADIEIVVPPNARGLVYVPATRPELVTESASGRAVPAAVADGVRLVGRQGDSVVFEVGSGRYQFGIAR